MAKTPCSQHRGPRVDPWSRELVSHVAQEDLEQPNKYYFFKKEKEEWTEDLAEGSKQTCDPTRSSPRLVTQMVSIAMVILTSSRNV